LFFLFDKLRHLFSAGRPPLPVVGGQPHPARLVFDKFRRVLAANNRSLEIIADMGEKLSGHFIFDQHYIETTAAELIQAVRHSIDCLQELCNGQFQELYDVHARLSDQICSLLEGREDRIGPTLLNLRQATPEHWAIVGGKNAHLAEMTANSTVTVPEGFVITTCMYHALVDHNELRALLDSFESRLADLKSTDIELEMLAKQLNAGILSASAPPGFLDEMAEHLQRLLDGAQVPIFLAIRSSAQEEDLDYSFAGQFQSILGVAPRSDLVFKAYLEVVASLFGPKALQYRRRLFPGEGKMSIAACCQRMIDAEISGIVHSVNPAEPGGRTMIIAGAWGQGEMVVEGMSPTDTFHLLNEEEPTIIKRIITEKPLGRFLSPLGQLTTQAIDPEQRSRPCLTDDQLLALARVARHLENFFKRPQDIEWAFDRTGDLYILQSRPLVLRQEAETRKTLPAALKGYEILAAGRGLIAQQGIGVGPVHLVDLHDSLDDFPEGAVLVSRRDSSQFVRVMHRTAAIITEVGTPVSHMATLCREMQVPCLVNVTGIADLVKEGEEITLDAEDLLIYRGRVTELLAYRASTTLNVSESREFRLLRRLLNHTARLHLLDPLWDDFAPKNCRTFHDILRFVHETAVIKLVSIGKDDHRLLRRHLARPLDLPIPAGILAIDIGGGLAETAPETAVPFRDVTSVPFKAILRGMLFPGVWHRATMPVGFKDLMNSMLRTPGDALNGQYIGHNIAVISANYVNLSFRFGYHFNLIDAHCDSFSRDNHIYFRFLGGATDLTKRSRRAQLIAIILKAFDFTVRTKGDLVIGRLGNIPQSEIERMLDILGRLIGFTRQIDVLMENDLAAERYAEAFLNGMYEVISN